MCIRDRGDRVLDLCAAPGGKSSQIAACLNGEGLLWSNEIVKNLAALLLSNLERMGVRNAVVSSSRPDALCPQLAGYFDKVLVDAPCSGEGMFRRDPQAIREWSEEHVRSCAVRQAAILDSAAEALRPGGFLAYSTCTFSPEEKDVYKRQLLNRVSELLSKLPPILRYEPEPLPLLKPEDGASHEVHVTETDGVYIVEGDWLPQFIQSVNFRCV